MKNQLSLSFLLVTTCLLLSGSLNAQVSKTVDVATAGTLSTLITASEKNQITHLTLTGNLNGTDIRYIREMAGKNVVNEKTAGKLLVLDLSQANIVAGGDFYYKDTVLRIGNNEPCYTADNVIGRSMFSGFTGLTQVVLPNSITSIAVSAFLGCTGLTSMVIPDQVTSIENAAFAYCTGLTSLTIGNHVSSIGSITFFFCTGLTSVRIPNSVTTIQNNAFGSCSGLTSMTIGSGIKSIGSAVFTNCKNLKEIGVSEENSSYCQVDGVLYNMDKTTLIQCPNARSGKYAILNGVEFIGNDAFSGCDSLTSITIPKSVISIRGYAFFPSSIKQIHCKALTPPSYGRSASLILDMELSDEFYLFTKACKIYVPKGTAAAYKNAVAWKNFKHIIEE